MSYIISIAILLILAIYIAFKIMSYKNSIQITLRPMKEWVILCKSASHSEREMMSHALLEEVSSLLEKLKVIAKKDFLKIFTKPEINYSDYVQFVLIATHTSYGEFNDSKVSYSNDQARVYLAQCFITLYENGLASKNGNLYLHEETFRLLASLCSSESPEEWSSELLIRNN